MKFWFAKNPSKDEKAPSNPTQPDAGEASSPALNLSVCGLPGTESPSVREPTAAPRRAAPAEHPAATSVRRDRKELYEGLMNALYDTVLVLDEKGSVVDASDRAATCLGRTREELWNCPVAELIPALDARALKLLHDGLHGRERMLVAATVRRADGSTFPAEIGGGLMRLVGECLVLTIRNREQTPRPLS